MKKQIITTLRATLALASTLSLLNMSPLLADDASKEKPVSESQQSKISALQNLIQSEIDASFLVSHAIANIKENDSLKNDLTEIKKAYEKNIEEMSKLLEKSEVPEHTKDFKGYFMQGYGAMRGLLSNQGVLEGLHTNLSLALSPLEKSLKSNLFTENEKKLLTEIYGKNQENVGSVKEKAKTSQANPKK